MASLSKFNTFNKKVIDNERLIKKIERSNITYKYGYHFVLFPRNVGFCLIILLVEAWISKKKDVCL